MEGGYLILSKLSISTAAKASVYPHFLTDQSSIYELQLQSLARPFHPRRLQTFFAIDQHAPAFTASPPIPCNHAVKILPSIIKHCIIEGSRLQPHCGDAEHVSLFEDLQRHRWRRHQGQRCL